MTTSPWRHEHTRPAIRMRSWRKPSRGGLLEDIGPEFGAIKRDELEEIENVCCS